MQVTHVMIGKSEPIAAKSGRSGINKRPVTGPVSLDIYGLAGDAIVDTDNHGGRDQAVYIFGGSDYAFWQTELGRSLAPGTFGENLILSDLSTHDVREGDRFTMGAVELRVTYPRIPCVTLAARMQDPAFPNRFSKTGHVGIYCAVETPGQLVAGSDVSWTHSGTRPILDLLPGYRAETDPTSQQ